MTSIGLNLSHDDKTRRGNLHSNGLSKHSPRADAPDLTDRARPLTAAAHDGGPYSTTPVRRSASGRPLGPCFIRQPQTMPAPASVP